MIVYNRKNKTPIVITYAWRADTSGGPATDKTECMIALGQGIDLSIVGLEPDPDPERDLLLELERAARPFAFIPGRDESDTYMIRVEPARVRELAAALAKLDAFRKGKPA